jgi:hypothetical protein
VHHDEIGVQDGFIGRVVEVNIQNLTVTAPVAAKVEDDALVLRSRSFESSRQIETGLFGSRVDFAGLRAGGCNGRSDDKTESGSQQNDRSDRRKIGFQEFHCLRHGESDLTLCFVTRTGLRCKTEGKDWDYSQQRANLNS